METEQAAKCSLCGMIFPASDIEEHARTAHTEQEWRRAKFERAKWPTTKEGRRERAKAAIELWKGYATPTDTISVYSLDEALFQPAVISLYWDARTCGFGGCNHGNVKIT